MPRKIFTLQISPLKIFQNVINLPNVPTRAAKFNTRKNLPLDGWASVVGGITNRINGVAKFLTKHHSVAEFDHTRLEMT